MSGRAGALALALACSLLASGCGLLPRDRDDGNGAAPAAQEPPGAPVVQLEVRAPDPLDDLLRTHLDLARLRSPEPVSEGELQRLVAAAPAQARSLLETEGYFDSSVSVLREPGDPPVVRLAVQPGPRTTVERLTFEVQGELERADERGDADARALVEQLRREWRLQPGEPFRDAEWSAEKNATLARMRAAGYASAIWSGTGAQVNAQTNRARLFVVADSGPLYRTGELVIEGLERQSATTVRNLAGFTAGTPATETLLLDFQERLQASGLFDRATVSFDPDPEDAGAVPIVVRLHELPLQQATVGVGISANTGPRITLEHLHRRPFGWRAFSRNKIELAQRRQAWEGELASQAQPGFYRNLVGGAAERLESDTDDVSSLRARVGRAQDTKDIDRLYFVELERALRRTDTTTSRADAISANYHGVWRDVDSVLLPTDGQAIALQGGVGYARSSEGPAGPYARTWGRLQVWRPIGSWFGQARVELGRVFVDDAVAVPETQRFRAGGDESVRGYAYRSLGPVRADGTVGSGRVIFTSSLEIARPLLERLPAVWGALFIDAGDAADDFSALDPAVGVGVGVRYRSPIGPLRVDLAWGERTRQPRLHLSVGVAF